MTITFAPVIPKPQVTESFSIGEKQIGEIVEYVNPMFLSRFHAVIKLRSESVCLAQGHGETKEQAIANAFAHTRREIDKALEHLAELEAALPAGFIEQHRAK